MDSRAGAQRRRWLRSWVREESFWRDVTARALSGLLVVAITFTAGWAGGYFDGPDGKFLLINTASVGLLVAGFAGFAVGVAWVAREVRAAEGPSRERVFWMRSLAAVSALLVLTICLTLVLEWAKGS